MAEDLSKIPGSRIDPNGLDIPPDSTKQDKLVSGTNIKTINNTTLLGSGNISVATAAQGTKADNAATAIATFGDVVTHDADEFATAIQGAKADAALQPNDNVSELTNDAGYITSSYHDSTKQDSLVSGTNIKTVNNTAILGSGNIAVQPTLVSGTNIKTINSTSLLGSGNVSLQQPLVSGTNIKTINGSSVLGSGDLAISGLPSQSGQSGKYLTTNGTAASWGTVEALPSQSGQSGKFLKTNGTSASWDTVTATTITYWE